MRFLAWPLVSLTLAACITVPADIPPRPMEHPDFCALLEAKRASLPPGATPWTPEPPPEAEPEAPYDTPWTAPPPLGTGTWEVIEDGSADSNLSGERWVIQDPEQWRCYEFLHDLHPDWKRAHPPDELVVLMADEAIDVDGGLHVAEVDASSTPIRIAYERWRVTESCPFPQGARVPYVLLRLTPQNPLADFEYEKTAERVFDCVPVNGSAAPAGVPIDSRPAAAVGPQLLQMGRPFAVLVNASEPWHPYVRVQDDHANFRDAFLVFVSAGYASSGHRFEVRDVVLSEGAFHMDGVISEPAAPPGEGCLTTGESFIPTESLWLPREDANPPRIEYHVERTTHPCESD